VPEEFIDAGDCVVAVIRLKAKGQSSGIEVERQDAIVYKLRDGQIVRGDYYNKREQALEAVGLREQPPASFADLGLDPEAREI
jgi:ketosteroid isomerase-like protein